MAAQSVWRRGVRGHHQYDAFEHLCRSLFKRPEDLFVMLTVHCDGSGQSNKDRVAVVSGYVASVTQWEDFVPHWQHALRDFDIKVMHRAHLENFQGEFEDWKPERRTAFLKRLQPIITAHTMSGLGAAVIKSDFDAVIPPAVRAYWGGVFGWCAQACVVTIRAWCEHVGHDDPIDWVFEVDTCKPEFISKAFTSLYNNPLWRRQYRMKLGGWAFKGKDLVPLQSADLVAYENFKEVENGVLDRHIYHPTRKSALGLFRAHEIPYFQYWDKARLAKWYRQWSASVDVAQALEEHAASKRPKRRHR